MKPEQIVDRLMNGIRSNMARHEVTIKIEVYELLLDAIERELGDIDEASSSEDERFSHNPRSEDEDEDD